MVPEVDSNLSVLVVDDDPLTRMLMKRMLTRMGCAVATAENGEIATAMVLGSASTSDQSGPIPARLTPYPRSPYAVVFMDNQMPVMSGLKAIKGLRELGRRDFVVGVTGKSRLFSTFYFVVPDSMVIIGNALLADQNVSCSYDAKCLYSILISSLEITGIPRSWGQLVSLTSIAIGKNPLIKK